MPGIGFSAAAQRFLELASACVLRSCGLTSWMPSVAELRMPLPVSPIVVDAIRTSGIARTSSSTCAHFSLPRCRLVPTGRSR